MGSDLIAAAVRLADALARENAALTAHDLPAAAALLTAKRAALAAFAAAGEHAAGPGQTCERPAARTVSAQLQALAEANHRLLERAIAAQGRVIAIVAEAASGHAPARMSGYTARGTIRRTAKPSAVTMAERV